MDSQLYLRINDNDKDEFLDAEEDWDDEENPVGSGNNEDD